MQIKETIKLKNNRNKKQSNKQRIKKKKNTIQKI